MVPAAHLSAERVVVPQVGRPIRVDGLTLIPFEGLHFRGTSGVPEMGYVAKFGGKCWLFPGDTRMYAAERLPRYNKVDGLIAHLWLGKGCAQEANPPLLEDFCRFCADLCPSQVVMTHLEELGRAEEDFWTLQHYALARSRLRELAPGIQVSPALLGQRISLE